MFVTTGVYYSTKKKSAHKQAKTAAATEEALKAAKKKSDKVKVKLDKGVSGVQHTRKVRLLTTMAVASKYSLISPLFIDILSGHVV